MDTGSWLGRIALALSLSMGLAASGHAGPAAPGLAVADLDYVDTSGETRDQRADHARRLQAFAQALREDLGANGAARVVALDCARAACSAIDKAAARAGATYLVLGGIHRMSTLVQWAKIAVVNVKTGAVVFDRLITFRGDDDTAWRRAATFVARDIRDRAVIR